MEERPTKWYDAYAPSLFILLGVVLWLVNGDPWHLCFSALGVVWLWLSVALHRKRKAEQDDDTLSN